MPTESTVATEAIALVIQRYESGEWKWGQKEEGVCVAIAIARAHSILGMRAPTMIYLTSAMRERQRLVKHPDTTFLQYAKGNAITYNDAEGRTLEDILTVLKKAKELAER